MAILGTCRLKTKHDASRRWSIRDVLRNSIIEAMGEVGIPGIRSIWARWSRDALRMLVQASASTLENVHPSDPSLSWRIYTDLRCQILSIVQFLGISNTFSPSWRWLCAYAVSRRVLVVSGDCGAEVVEPAIWVRPSLGGSPWPQHDFTSADLSTFASFIIVHILNKNASNGNHLPIST